MRPEDRLVVRVTNYTRPEKKIVTTVKSARVTRLQNWYVPQKNSKTTRPPCLGTGNDIPG